MVSVQPPAVKPVISMVPVAQISEPEVAAVEMSLAVQEREPEDVAPEVEATVKVAEAPEEVQG